MNHGIIISEPRTSRILPLKRRLLYFVITRTPSIIAPCLLAVRLPYSIHFLVTFFLYLSIWKMAFLYGYSHAFNLEKSALQSELQIVTNRSKQLKVEIFVSNLFKYLLNKTVQNYHLRKVVYKIWVLYMEPWRSLISDFYGFMYSILKCLNLKKTYIFSFLMNVETLLWNSRDVVQIFNIILQITD